MSTPLDIPQESTKTSYRVDQAVILLSNVLRILDDVQIGADEYEVLKLINFIRKEVLQRRDPRPFLASHLDQSAEPLPRPVWREDTFLTPALEQDEMLLHDWSTKTTPGDQGGVTSSDEGRRLENPVDDPVLAAAFEDMRRMALTDPSVQAFLAHNIGREEDASMVHEEGTSSHLSSQAKHLPSSAPGDSSMDSSIDRDRIIRQSGSGRGDTAAAKIDEAYFESYSFFDIHREMLSDRPRTEAYRNALERNPSLIRGATVFDVGCGTGILSMFAMRGGASRVYAVDGSPVMADVARRVCCQNGFGGGEEGPITIIGNKVENVERLSGGDWSGVDDTKVDVLVSEWMGKQGFWRFLSCILCLWWKKEECVVGH